MIFGEPCGAKASWHLSYRWGRTPKKPHPGILSRPGIELRPATWQARVPSSAPQLWAFYTLYQIIFILNVFTFCLNHVARENLPRGNIILVTGVNFDQPKQLKLRDHNDRNVWVPRCPSISWMEYSQQVLLSFEQLLFQKELRKTDFRHKAVLLQALKAPWDMWKQESTSSLPPDTRDFHIQWVTININ